MIRVLPISTINEDEKNRINSLKFLTLVYKCKKLGLSNEPILTDHMIKLTNNLETSPHRYHNSGDIHLNWGYWDQYLMCITSDIIQGIGLKNRVPNVDEEHLSLLELNHLFTKKDTVEVKAIEFFYNTLLSNIEDDNINDILTLYKSFTNKIIQTLEHTKLSEIVQEKFATFKLEYNQLYSHHHAIENNINNIKEIIQSMKIEYPMELPFRYFLAAITNKVSASELALQFYLNDQQINTKILNHTINIINKSNIKIDKLIIGNILPLQNIHIYKHRQLHIQNISCYDVDSIQCDGISTKEKIEYVQGSSLTLKLLKDLKLPANQVIIEEIDSAFINILTNFIENNKTLKEIEITKVSGTAEIAESDIIKLFDVIRKHTLLKKCEINLKNCNLINKDGTRYSCSFISDQLKDCNNIKSKNNDNLLKCPQGYTTTPIQKHFIHGQKYSHSSKDAKYPTAQLEHNTTHAFSTFFNKAHIKSILKALNAVEKISSNENNFTIIQFINITESLYQEDLSPHELQGVYKHVLNYLNSHNKTLPLLNETQQELYEMLIDVFKQGKIAIFKTFLKNPPEAFDQHVQQVYIEYLQGKIKESEIYHNIPSDGFTSLIKQAPILKVYGDELNIDNLSNIISTLKQNHDKHQEGEVYILEKILEIYQNQVKQSSRLMEVSIDTLQRTTLSFTN